MVQLKSISIKSVIKAVLPMLLLCTPVPGCSKSPVLYPNDHLNNVGKAQADSDIRECMEMAEKHNLKSQQGEKVAKSTAIGAGGGAVGGAVGGAISGNVGRGVATGAASGAAVGLFYGLFKAAEPSPTYKAFVNKCLSDKGYEPIGWE
jgi:outer membrane lipoprotein SlyB